VKGIVELSLPNLVQDGGVLVDEFLSYVRLRYPWLLLQKVHR